jgi:LPXTG-motif cell wall-anchored protein
VSKKNLARVAAALGAAAAIAGPLTAANASAAETPPYDCAVALPLLDQENPIVLAALGCKDNTAKFTAEHAGADTGSGDSGTGGGIEAPSVPGVPDLPGLPGGGQDDGGDTPTPAPTPTPTPAPAPGDDGGPGQDQGDEGDQTPTPTPAPGDQGDGGGDQGGPGNSDAEPGTDKGDGPGKSENAPGHDGDKGDEGNKGKDTIDLAGAEANKDQLAQTGSDDNAAPMLAGAGGLIAMGAGAIAFKRRQNA